MMIPPMSADVEKDPRHYTVSVTFERWLPESEEPVERGYDIERQEFDCEELAALQSSYGFNEPSSTLLGANAPIWFSATSPREDREHFEQGVDKFYQLHLNEVDGATPTQADYQRVGGYLGIGFANSVADEEPTQRPKP